MKEPKGKINSYTSLIQWFLESKNIVVFTGAGMSTESGIPDFRSPEGIWSRYDLMEYGTIEAFLSNPKTVWKFFIELYNMAKDAKPNLGHHYLVKLENFKRKQAPNASFIIITQNIDSFHQEAGSSKVIELHGNGKEVVCMNCRRVYPFDSIDINSLPPTCPHCSSLLKVNAILFGESLPMRAFSEARKAVENSDLLLVLGTSLEVSPANTLVLSSKGKKVLINLSKTPYDHYFDAIIYSKISDALEKMVNLIDASD